MKISNKNLYFVMIGVSAFMLLLIIGAVVGGEILLRKQAIKNTKQKLDIAVLEKEQLSLIQSKVDLEKYSELKSIAKQIVPQDKDQAVTVRQIIALAEKSGITIGDISFPTSTLGGPNSSGSTTNSTSPKAAATNTNVITQAKPVTGSAGLYALEISVASDNARPSTYKKFISFLESLENNRRTAHVTQISINPDSKDTSLLNFNLTLTVYIKP